MLKHFASDALSFKSKIFFLISGYFTLECKIWCYFYLGKQRSKYLILRGLQSNCSDSRCLLQSHSLIRDQQDLNTVSVCLWMLWFSCHITIKRKPSLRDCIFKFQCVLHDQSKSLIFSLKSKESWDRVKSPFPTKTISAGGPNPWIDMISSSSKLNPTCLLTDLRHSFLQESPL